jgi:hypothetical protein
MEKEIPGYPSVQIPFDSATGFHQSFEVHQKEQYTQFFKTYGFVVVDNILNAEEIDRTICEVWGEGMIEIEKSEIDHFVLHLFFYLVLFRCVSILPVHSLVEAFDWAPYNPAYVNNKVR